MYYSYQKKLYTKEEMDDLKKIVVFSKDDNDKPEPLFTVDEMDDAIDKAFNMRVTVHPYRFYEEKAKYFKDTFNISI